MSSFEFITNPEEAIQKLNEEKKEIEEKFSTVSLEEMTETIQKLNEKIKEMDEKFSSISFMFSSISKEFSEFKEYKDQDTVKEIFELLKTEKKDEWVLHFNAIPPHLLKKVNDLYCLNLSMVYFENLGAYFFYKAGYDDILKMKKNNHYDILYYAIEFNDYETIDKLNLEGYISLSECKSQLEKAVNEDNIKYIEYWLEIRKSKEK